MSNETKEILEHLKEYLQSKIDNNEHKIFYNDLMWDEKTIDCINAIDDLLDYTTNLQQKYDKSLEDNVKESHKRMELQQENERLTSLCIGHEKELRTKDIIIKKIRNEQQDYKSRCEKASDKLGNYKHYSTPTEEQNSENEDIVDSALNILQNGSESQ